MPKPIGVLLDERDDRILREYLDTEPIPPEEDNVAERVDRLIEDMKKEAENGNVKRGNKSNKRCGFKTGGN